jgi:hypothetical protein
MGKGVVSAALHTALPLVGYGAAGYASLVHDAHRRHGPRLACDAPRLAPGARGPWSAPVWCAGNAGQGGPARAAPKRCQQRQQYPAPFASAPPPPGQGGHPLVGGWAATRGHGAATPSQGQSGAQADGALEPALPCAGPSPRQPVAPWVPPARLASGPARWPRARSSPASPHGPPRGGYRRATCLRPRQSLTIACCARRHMMITA